MVTTFYILVMLCLVFKVFNLVAFDHLQMLINYYDGKENRNQVEYSAGYSLYLILSFLSAAIFFVGMFTSQWLLFAMILALSVFKIGGLSSRAKYIRQSIVVVLLIFTILNKYHFHINLTNIFF